MISLFGSWERRFGQLVYTISAKCDCEKVIHKHEYILSPIELDTLRFDPFPIIREQIERKFTQIHQTVVYL